MGKRKKLILLGSLTAAVLFACGTAAYSGGALTQMNAPAPTAPAFSKPLPPLAKPLGAPPIAAPIAAAPIAQAPVAAVQSPQAGAPATPAAPSTAPFTGAARLSTLDALHADIEQAKLEGELAELRAKKRDAESGMGRAAAAGGSAVAGSALPPMPAFPAGGISNMMPVSLDAPPAPPSRRGGSASAASLGAGAGGTEFLEAWGSGKDVQARVMTSAGERIVRVGDSLPGGGRVSSITGNTLTITDTHGKSRTIN